MSKVDQLRELREAKHAKQQSAKACLDKSKVKAAAAINARRKKAKAALVEAITRKVSHMANTGKSTYRYRDQEQRREYQRDLMRKRRAAKKDTSLCQ